MTYDVEWLPDAEQELAAVRLGASDQPAVTAAAHAIDQRLRLDPEDTGESRPGGRRIVFSKPLGAIFRVLRNQRQVQVLHVWHY